jgi:hypothetical protein
VYVAGILARKYPCGRPCLQDDRRGIRGLARAARLCHVIVSQARLTPSGARLGVSIRPARPRSREVRLAQGSSYPRLLALLRAARGSCPPTRHPRSHPAPPSVASLASVISELAAALATWPSPFARRIRPATTSRSSSVVNSEARTYASRCWTVSASFSASCTARAFLSCRIFPCESGDARGSRRVCGARRKSRHSNGRPRARHGQPHDRSRGESTLPMKLL